MHVKAYVLAADPTWVERSISAYYDHVAEIVVSFDRDNRGWTGRPIAASAVVRTIRAMDRDHKCRFVAGSFRGSPPIVGDTRQRQAALDAVGECDWVLQIDTDEVLPVPEQLTSMLATLPSHLDGVEWPMRVLFRRLGRDRYAEVSEEDGGMHVEYPGCIAVRPGVELVDARRVSGCYARVVTPDADSLQLRRPPGPVEYRIDLPAAPIVHNSWARSPRVVAAKVRSWGHNEGLDSLVYYCATWFPARWRWGTLTDFHPFARGLWPRLREVTLG